MAIRLRRVEGAGLVAVCAARSVAQPGDVYLDDETHYALAEKFWLDYADETLGLLPTPAPQVCAAIARAESANPARADWDRTFGAPDHPSSETR